MASKKAEVVLGDLISKEMMYLKCLQALKYVVLQPLKDAIELEEPILTQEEIEAIFSNHIESFLSLSQVIFLELLKLKERGDIEAVGEVFAKQGDWLKCYKDYVAHTAERLERLKRTKQQNARFAIFLEEVHEILRQSNVHDDLSTLLIRPSRQLTIYLQSIELLQKEYDKSNKLAAGLRKIKEVLDVVGKTEVEREAEFLKMKTLQNRIRGRINLCEPHRVMIDEAMFTLLPEIGAQNGVSSPSTLPLESASGSSSTAATTATNSTMSSGNSGGGSEESTTTFLPAVLNTLFSPGAVNSTQRLHLILFNDALLVAVPLRKNKLSLERFVPLERVHVLVPPERLPSDCVLYVDSFGYVYRLECKSAIEREKWEHLITTYSTKARANLTVGLSKSPREKDTTTVPSQSSPSSPSSSSNVTATTRTECGSGNKTASSSSSYVPVQPQRRGAGGGTLSPSTMASHRLTTMQQAAPHRPASTSIHLMFKETMIYEKVTHLVLNMLQTVGSSSSPSSSSTSSVPATDDDHQIPIYVGTGGAILGRNPLEPGGDSKGFKGFIVIPNDESVSRQHCQITYNHKLGVFYIQDLNSANNTTILHPKDSTKNIVLTAASPPHPLHEGMRFQVGRTIFQVSKIHILNASSPNRTGAMSATPVATTVTIGSNKSQSPLQMVGTVRIPQNTSNVHDKTLLAQLQLIDEDEGPSDLFPTVSSRRVKVYVDEEVRGMIVVESDKRIASIRKLIYRTLLRKHEQQLWHADEVPLLLNGTIPIPTTQNSRVLFDYLRDDDYLVVCTAPSRDL